MKVSTVNHFPGITLEACPLGSFVSKYGCTAFRVRVEFVVVPKCYVCLRPGKCSVRAKVATRQGCRESVRERRRQAPIAGCRPRAGPREMEYAPLCQCTAVAGLLGTACMAHTSPCRGRRSREHHATCPQTHASCALINSRNALTTSTVLDTA